MKWLTGPLTRSRREAIALAAREQVNAGVLRLQRNAYRDHGRRMALAIAEVNAAWSSPPTNPAAAPWAPHECERVQEALNQAMAVSRMALVYDALQSQTDPTIQENRP